MVNDNTPPSSQQPSPSTANGATWPSDFMLLIRWSLGLWLVIICGWGLIGLAFYISRKFGYSSEFALTLSSGFSLALLLLLESNHWLSRFMGLRFNPEAPSWHSAVLIWFLGVPGLLFRSTVPATAATDQTQPRAEPLPPQQTDSFREVLETVVFVVVLVLLLKSFVAEAFVIPTGSMATTLLGYQKDVTCPKCGFTFPVNCSEEVEGRQRRTVVGAVCPNCRYHVDFHEDHMNPACGSGDRVLVAKFLYDSGLLNPQRLDVVVFKYPERPQVDHVPMNYIKRLIGLPGETIGIYYGKLYALPPDKGNHYPEDQQRADPHDLWKPQFMHIGDTRDLLEQRDSPFGIVRKSPDKILALRRIVHDNDYPAKDVDLPRWTSEDGAWAPADNHGFHDAGGQSSALQWLRYQHILRPLPGDPDFQPKTELITDFMGYNSKAFGRNEPEFPSTSGNWVGDLILECQVTVEQAAGDLVFELSKGVDRFRASWDLSTGNCTLSRINAGKEAKLGEAKPTSLSKPGKYRVRFANVDERLTVWVDGNLPFGDGVAYDPPDMRGPTENDLQPASIGCRGGAAAIHHLSLWRDTYYTVGVMPATDSDEVRRLGGNKTEMRKLFSDPSRFPEAFGHLPANTFYVQPGHYLCLGDNSPESSDGRSWGLVPRRLLLGRALLVYFPIFDRGGRIK